MSPLRTIIASQIDYSGTNPGTNSPRGTPIRSIIPTKQRTSTTDSLTPSSFYNKSNNNTG